MKKVHFVGVYGAGMSALAQFHAMGGGATTGSDRFLDQGKAGDIRKALEKTGVSLFPQDGSGISRDTATVVVSTAIEADNPELVQAGDVGIEVVHRADWLARIVREHKTIAVAGTSGKSTVSAMLYTILKTAGFSPSVITGAGLHALEAEGLLGNAKRGASDLLVIEADESDGSLPKYEPWLGVLLNFGKDHKELDELERIFSEFNRKCEKFSVNADETSLSRWMEGAVTFGFGPASVHAENLVVNPEGSTFSVEGVSFQIPLPGQYNAANALAAICAAREAGVSLKDSSRALEGYNGIARRYDYIGEAGGVRVIDDYAHNPDKIRAVLSAAHAQVNGGKLCVLFQPHGFGPTRFLKDDLVEAFSEGLAEGDVAWFSPIFYAGGTAAKDISSDDLAAPLRERGIDARSPDSRPDAGKDIVETSKAGDLVLVLGARDPSLPQFAKDILGGLS